MLVSRGSPTPVILEMRPSRTSTSPSPPSPPPSPKAVRFASRSSGLVRSTREPTDTEAWSAWRFEHHAYRCGICHDPEALHARHEPLCGTGRALAHDVSLHFSYNDGDVYSIHHDPKNQPERIELHHHYIRVRALLKSLSPSQTLRAASPEPTRRRRHHHHHHGHRATIISYDEPADHSRPRSISPPRRRHTESIPVTLEPAHSASLHRRRSTAASSSKSKHRSTRYSTVVVDDDVTEFPTMTPSRYSTNATVGTDENSIPIAAPSSKYKATKATSSSQRPDALRRGSLYESDLRRAEERETGQRIEVREPTARRSKREKEVRK